MQLGSCCLLCASTHHHVRESGKRGRPTARWLWPPVPMQTAPPAVPAHPPWTTSSTTRGASSAVANSCSLFASLSSTAGCGGGATGSSTRAASPATRPGEGAFGFASLLFSQLAAHHACLPAWRPSRSVTPPAARLGGRSFQLVLLLALFPGAMASLRRLPACLPAGMHAPPLMCAPRPVCSAAACTGWCTRTTVRQRKLTC